MCTVVSGEISYLFFREKKSSRRKLADGDKEPTPEPLFRNVSLIKKTKHRKFSHKVQAQVHTDVKLYSVIIICNEKSNNCKK